MRRARKRLTTWGIATVVLMFCGAGAVSVLTAFEHAAAQSKRRSGYYDSEYSQSKRRAARRERRRSGRPPLDIPLPVRPTEAPKSASKTKDTKAAPDAKAGKDEKNAKDAKDAAEAPPPDEWPQTQIVTALRECIRLLGPIAAEIEVEEPIKNAACGAPAPVLLKRVGSVNPVTLSPPATVNCPMVVALHRWVETELQPQAERLLGSRIVSLSNVSAYSCRMRNGSAIAKLSEHALANAIDIGRFETADGQTISVAADWGPTERDIARSEADAPGARSGKGKAKESDEMAPEPKRVAARRTVSLRRGEIPLPERRPEPKKSEAKSVAKEDEKEREILKPSTSVKAEFLKRVHEQACGMFGTVLGPEANEAHRDHFHLDLAPRRRRSFCE